MLEDSNRWRSKRRTEGHEEKVYNSSAVVGLVGLLHTTQCSAQCTNIVNIQSGFGDI